MISVDKRSSRLALLASLLGAAAVALLFSPSAWREASSLHSTPAVSPFRQPIIHDGPLPFTNDRHFAHFINDEWLRGSGPIIHSPMLPDISHDDDFEVLPPATDCQTLTETVRKHGVNGAALRVNVNDVHYLGHAFYRVALERGLPLEPIVRAAVRLASGGITYRTKPRDEAAVWRLGYMHGTHVAFLGNWMAQIRATTPLEEMRTWVPDWGTFHRTYCDANDDTKYLLSDQCMHGFGHVFHYSQFRSMYPTPALHDEYCLDPPLLSEVSDISHALEAERLCLSHPSATMGRSCLWGVWHGTMEWTQVDSKTQGYHQSQLFKVNPDGTNSGKRATDPLYPCTDPVLQSTSPCFSLYALYLWFGDWRAVNATRSPGGMLGICDRVPSLKQQAGCIYGFSALFYPVYDYAAFARTDEELDSPPSRVWNSSLTAFDIALGWDGVHNYWKPGSGAPDGHLDVLYGKDFITREHTNVRYMPFKRQRNTLVGWCELFVSEKTRAGLALDQLDEAEWQRWKACVMGSFSFSARFVYEVQHEEDKAKQRKCPELLEVTWLNRSLALASYEICLLASSPPPVKLEGNEISHPLDEHLWF
ncbi:MAG: hypothetical protein SGPRY_014462 [Prymnesium sp.]